MWLERPGPAKRTIGPIVCTHDIDGTRSLKPIRFFWIDDFSFSNHVRLAWYMTWARQNRISLRADFRLSPAITRHLHLQIPHMKKRGKELSSQNMEACSSTPHPSRILPRRQLVPARSTKRERMEGHGEIRRRLCQRVVELDVTPRQLQMERIQRRPRNPRGRGRRWLDLLLPSGQCQPLPRCPMA
jgi:hypothetical protein